MSKQFFNELNLPNANINLNVGSGLHGEQTGLIMMRLEKAICRSQADLVVVPGDTNSTLAGALVASKLGVPVAHVESGARSYDITMPEEVNRRLTDHCSKILFSPTKNCQRNLEKEHVIGDIFFVGDTMLDALVQHRDRAFNSNILERLGLHNEEYMLLTLHRPGNVDNLARLGEIIRGILQLKNSIIVFPAHPRTRVRLKKARLLSKILISKTLKLIEPIAYHDMIMLTNNASIVLTDSGGLQREAFWLGKPCIILRENTEWIETLRCGCSLLVGKNYAAISSIVRYMSKKKTCEVPEQMRIKLFGEGKASERIISILKAYL
jgi:UDP-N-acetylglucosamine 2-epimerase